MARPPRIFWLASLALAAYLVWRWRMRQEVEAFRPAAPPAAPPEPPPTPAMRAETTSTPRRIPTRVHRGAPPSVGDRAKQAVAEVKTAATEVAEQVHHAAAQAAEAAQHTAEKAAEAGAEALEQAREALGAAVEQAQEAGADLAEQVEDRTDEAARAVGEAAATVRTLVAPGEEGEAAAPTGPVNVNTADLETLIALPGIGAVLAERIVRYRAENGPFQSIEELIEVPGIGARNLETFRHLITV
jgi:competence protein ComEA